MSDSGSTELGVPGRLRRTAGRINRELFWERDRRAARSVLVLGSGRSGTTWLAEVIAKHCRSRLIFEPFHPHWSPENMKLFADPERREEKMHRSVDRVLAGSVRGRQVDQVMITRLPRGRVVKDIHANNLAPWFRQTFPSVPVVYVVRHPIAASVSRLKSGTFYGLGDYLETENGRRDIEGSPGAKWLPIYDEQRKDDDPLVRHVAEWCIENAYALSCADEHAIEVVHYETAVLDPVNEGTRLVELCRGALGGQARDMTIGAVRKPSAKDSFGTAAGAAEERDWNSILSRWTDEVSTATVDRCLRVVAEFGIDIPYGDGPLPQEKIQAK